MQLKGFIAYYPNATTEVYQGVSGYIYKVEKDEACYKQADIPFAMVTSQAIRVIDSIYIPDAYEALLTCEAQGLIQIRRYENHSEKMLSWIRHVLTEDYEMTDRADYKTFLKGKFEFLE